MFAKNVKQMIDKREQQTRPQTGDSKIVQPEWDPSEAECEDNPYFPTCGRPKGDKVMVKLCPECGQEFQRRKGTLQKAFSGYDEHVMQHKVNNFSCNCADVPKLAAVDKLLVDCGDERPHKRDTYWQKERHMKLIHMGWVACSQCERTFKSELLLSSHMKEHETT